MLRSSTEVTQPPAIARATSYGNDVRNQPSAADRPLPFTGPAAQTAAVGSGLKSLHVNANNSGVVVPVLPSDVEVTKRRVMMSQPQLLLPPTAFMSRSDGTPIVCTETVGRDPQSCVPASDIRLKSILRCVSCYHLVNNLWLELYSSYEEMCSNFKLPSLANHRTEFLKDLFGKICS